jgi:LPS-assembly protein
LRGSFESKGQFYIADQWKFGWEFTLLSDKWYLNDYHVPSQTISSNYFAETTSTVYLNGQGDRGYFDLRGYYFEGLTSHDFQPQQPLAHPVWDYNKTFDIDPAKSYGIGGQAELDFNLTSLSASSASFEVVGPRFWTMPLVFMRSADERYLGPHCGLPFARRRRRLPAPRSMRLEAQIHRSDRRSSRLSPSPGLMANGSTSTPQIPTRSRRQWRSTIQRSQLNFVGNKDTSFFGEFIPGTGLITATFLAKTRFASMVFEPIMQIVARPNQQIERIRSSTSTPKPVLTIPCSLSKYPAMTGSKPAPG